MKKISLKKSVAAASAAVMILAGVPALGASAASSNTYSDTYKYYSNVTGLYYDSLDEASRVSQTSNNRTWSPYYNYGYYNGYYNNYYYGYNYNYDYPYYSSYTKQYYRSYTDALNASSGNANYVTYVGNYYYSGYLNGYSTATPYYSTVTNKYYGTYEEAFKASNNRGDYVIYYGANSGTAYYPGYSYVNYSTYNRYYPYSYYNYYDYYYRNGRYYDPAYYYYDYYYYNYTPRTTTTKTVVRNSSNVEASSGIPYFKGYKKIWGWTVISDRIANSSLRSSTTIMMNGATNLPTEFLKASKAKETNLKLILANGVTWDISGTHIGDVEEVNIDVVYGTNNVPDYLVKAATQDAVSCAQITVGEGTKTLGFTGTATVKFPATRADCFVKAYVYDPQEDNLKLVDKTIIDAHGHAKLALKYSGNYLLVLS